MKALVTRKIGMTSIIMEDGAICPVTLLSAQPNTVTQVKTTEIDGYNAIQVGTEVANKNNKSLLGHLKPSKASSKVIREFRLEDKEEDLSVGSELTAEVFSIGDKVNVQGTSKGKGFAGTIKRHNFHRQRKTHGGKGNTRQPGSIGSMYPQHIFKGKKMAGRMGNEKVSVLNQEIALVDTENNIIGVKGAVPGPRKSLVLVRAISSKSGGNK